MTDTDCFLQAVREYRATELLMGRVMGPFEEWNTDDRTRVLARAEEFKRESREGELARHLAAQKPGCGDAPSLSLGASPGEASRTTVTRITHTQVTIRCRR